MVAAALRRLSNRLLGMAFASWAEHAVEQRGLRQRASLVCQRWMQCTLRSAFGAWTEWVQERRQHSGQLALAVTRWRGATLRAAWLTWAERAGELRERRGKLAAAVGLWQSHQLRGALAAWQDWVEFRRRAKQVGGGKRPRTCTLNAWQWHSCSDSVWCARRPSPGYSSRHWCVLVSALCGTGAGALCLPGALPGLLHLAVSHRPAAGGFLHSGSRHCSLAQ